jgi:DNA (cytosine-5)-methyltransferase 1
MKVLSLFSGVGGFDMGLENAGMQTVFQCEWDKHCRTILDRHWPTVPKWDDVSTLTGEHILTHAPVIDVVAWGSPCQDLSVAGKRSGLEGERSGLFHQGIRIIKELRKASNGRYPRISIWENVYGALNSNKGEDFEAILKEMVEAGSLLCEWRVLDAQYFGVPQRRRRVFVVAVFDPATAARCPDPLLPISEGLLWHPTTGATTREESADTPSASIGNGSQPLTFTKSPRAQSATDDETWVEGKPAPTLNSFDQGDVRATTAIVFENSYRDGARIANDHVTQTLSAKMGTGGGNTPMLAIAIQDGREIEKNQNGLGVADEGAPAYTIDQTGAQAVAYGIQGNMIGRQDHNGPAGKGHTDEGDPMFTLNTTDKHAVATTMVVRRLTPLECERLMGWPDDHTRYKADGTEQADTHRYKQCGNGVASPVAEWIGEQLRNL